MYSAVIDGDFARNFTYNAYANGDFIRVPVIFGYASPSSLVMLANILTSDCTNEGKFQTNILKELSSRRT